MERQELSNPREWRRLAPGEATKRGDVLDTGVSRWAVAAEGTKVSESMPPVYRRVRLTPCGLYRYLDIGESLDLPGVEMDANDDPEAPLWEAEQRRFHHRDVACADRFRVPVPPPVGGYLTGDAVAAARAAGMVTTGGVPAAVQKPPVGAALHDAKAGDVVTARCRCGVVLVTVSDGNDTRLEHVPGIGASAPVPTVLADDPCGDDVAADLADAEMRRLRARGVR